MADITVRPAHAREKLNGKDNFKTWSARMKSDLQGQALWRFTDKDTLRERPERETGEKVDMFEDRVDAYDAKVQKSRTYILDSCDIWIAD